MDLPGVRSELDGRLVHVTARQSELLAKAVAMEQEDAAAAGAIGFTARLWCQVSLPYKDPGQVPDWIRRNGSVEMVVHPGRIIRPDGSRIYGYPFGVIPRLLMSWMATEAVATRDPVLDLGTSALRFMRVLDMPSDGRAYARLRDQVQRLAGASILVTDMRANSMAGGTFSFADSWDLWWTPKDQQDTLFPSTITLSEKFYRSILESPVPIDLRALSVLRRSGGGGLPIDIYVWLAHRMHSLGASGRSESTPIPWEYLAVQFGSQYQRTRAFRAKFVEALRDVLATAYRQARVTVTDEGLVLRPSPTPVAPKQQPR